MASESKKTPWKYIKTKTGESVKIDAEDFDDVNSRSWRVTYSTKTNKPSVVTSIRTGASTRTMSLGQYLMKPPKGKQVYPRRWQGGLDYRKSNLLVISMKERQRMLPKRGFESSSRYKGVTYIAAKKLWRARVEKDGQSHFIGDFETERAAAMAYNETALELFGDIAYQNQIRRRTDRRVGKASKAKKKKSA